MCEVTIIELYEKSRKYLVKRGFHFVKHNIYSNFYLNIDKHIRITSQY
nr:MAG TPA: hypothetical protein [Caudoviricetes sp.]